MDHGYKKLEIYQLAHQYAVELHLMSLQLPKFEMYEEGSQTRRSSKSVSAQIVEGYALRKNKKEFLQYLGRAYASACETKEHLELLFETKSLADEALYQRFISNYELLSAKIFRFITAVMDGHETPRYVREENVQYNVEHGIDTEDLWGKSEDVEDESQSDRTKLLEDVDRLKSDIRNLQSVIGNLQSELISLNSRLS